MNLISSLQESDMSIRPLSRRSCSMGVIVDSLLPHLVAMDDDILSTGIVMYHLKVGSGKCNAWLYLTFPVLLSYLWCCINWFH